MRRWILWTMYHRFWVFSVTLMAVVIIASWILGLTGYGWWSRATLVVGTLLAIIVPPLLMQLYVRRLSRGSGGS